MSDQTSNSVLTNAPVPQPTEAEPGAVITDPQSIGAALQNLSEQQHSSPRIKWAGEREEPAMVESPVTAAELKPPLEPQKAAPPQKTEFPKPTQEGAPVWAIVPPELVFPQGRPVYFLRFDARMTYTPKQGIAAPDNGKLYRQCIFWPMSVGDKKFAAGRSMGDQIRFSDEMVKSCIRAIDGQAVNLANATFDIWWDQVGEKVRSLLHRLFGQLHYLTPEETSDFLEHCIEARSAG
jgi:hypothetical protein